MPVWSKRATWDGQTYALELLDTKVLRHDEDLLAMLVRTQDLRTLADDQDAIISVEKAEQVVRIADDVPGLT